MPFISIFIPAYKNIGFLKRLLESIRVQNFTDYEVIVTDDSPGNEVELLTAQYILNNASWHYLRNDPAQGMPKNWNRGLGLCQGEWLKIMHDDDWFSSSDSLGIFAERAQNTNKTFLFSAYTNVYANGKTEQKNVGNYRKNLLAKEPMSLLSDNVVGPPSVCMVHHSVKQLYDERLRWRVDIDYYIRVLQGGNGFCYMDEPLVNIGIGTEQITNEVKYNKAVELPEALIILHKYGVSSLRNIVVYDSWWRFVRNLKIQSVSDLNKYVDCERWPIIIQFIVKDLNKLPPSLQRNGGISKLAMLLSYFKNYSKINA